MGKRRFRLYHAKNFERKKYGEKRKEDQELIVRVDFSHFSRLTVATNDMLIMRLQSAVDRGLMLPRGWVIEGNSIQRGFGFGTMAIRVSQDCSWNVAIDGQTVCLANVDGSRTTVTMLQFDDPLLNSIHKVILLLTEADCAKLCVANPEEKFITVRDRRKGRFISQKGELVGFHDTRTLPSPTIRSTSCSMFIHEESLTPRCDSCNEHRKSLFALVSKSKSPETAVSNYTNHRYLSTPEKVGRLRSLGKKNRLLQRKVKEMRMKLDEVMKTDGVTIDSEVSKDLEEAMHDCNDEVSAKFPDKSFQSIFWKHQMDSLHRKGKARNGTRWHPLMIRWCLYLRHFSGKAYDAIRDSGCIALPSQRTLRDYSNAVKADVGFSPEVDEQLRQAANLQSFPSYHSLSFLLLDEMHVRDDLVYNKHTGKLVGFVNLGDVNNHLARFEELLESSDDEVDIMPIPLANSIMVFMVRGVFTSLKFPYAMFPCSGLCGEQLFMLFWDCVFRLERIGFKILGTTFDGASVNRRLVALHDTSDKLVYKLRNIYAQEERFIYCFSDPPHLIKTVRNCWASKRRTLWNKKDISWQHLINLYSKDSGKGSGLSIVPKLKFEHLHLTSFSKMRVDLAAQVLSETISKALSLTGGAETTETAKFCGMFDKFFDVLNVSNFTNGRKARKPFQAPFYNAEDERLEWLEKEFIPYLDEWETCVNSRKDFSETQKKNMLLSCETLLGIRRTVKSFIGLVQKLFSMSEVKEHKLALLTNHLCQDPLESFFGCQRQRGGTGDNPSISEFFANTQALRVVDSFCRGPVRGNCRGGVAGNKRTSADSELINTPLMKRRRKTNNSRKLNLK